MHNSEFYDEDDYYDEDIYKLYGEIFEREEDYKRAVINYKKALDGGADCADDLAQCYILLKDYTNAELILNEEIFNKDKEKINGRIYFLLAQVYGFDESPLYDTDRMLISLEKGAELNDSNCVATLYGLEDDGDDSECAIDDDEINSLMFSDRALCMEIAEDRNRLAGLLEKALKELYLTQYGKLSENIKWSMNMIKDYVDGNYEIPVLTLIPIIFALSAGVGVGIVKLWLGDPNSLLSLNYSCNHRSYPFCA